MEQFAQSQTFKSWEISEAQPSAFSSNNHPLRWPTLQPFILDHQFQNLICSQEHSSQNGNSYQTYTHFRYLDTDAERISYLISLRKYITSIRTDDDAQEQFIGNFDIRLLIELLLQNRFIQQVQFQIEQVLYSIYQLQTNRPLYHYVFIDLAATVERVLLKLLQSQRKVTNQFAIDILNRVISDDNPNYMKFALQENLISRIHCNIVRLSIPSKKALCQIIIEVVSYALSEVCRVQYMDVVTIMNLLITELPRMKEYLAIDLKGAFKYLVSYFRSKHLDYIEQHFKQIQQLLDLGVHFRTQFCLLLSWIVNDLDLSKFKINQALEQLLILLDNQEDNNNGIILQIISGLVAKHNQLTFRQSVRMKDLIYKVISKGASSTNNSFYQQNLIRFYAQLLKNHIQLLKKQHIPAIVETMIKMYRTCSYSIKQQIYHFISSTLKHKLQLLPAYKTRFLSFRLGKIKTEHKKMLIDSQMRYLR